MGHAARQQPQAHKSFHQRMVNKVNVLEWLSQSLDLNPIKILWKDLSKQFNGGNSPTSQSLRGSALRNGLKLQQVMVQKWSACTINFTFSYCSKTGVTPDTEIKDAHTLCRNIENAKGFTNFLAALYVVKSLTGSLSCLFFLLISTKPPNLSNHSKTTWLLFSQTTPRCCLHFTKEWDSLNLCKCSMKTLIWCTSTITEDGVLSWYHRVEYFSSSKA